MQEIPFNKIGVIKSSKNPKEIGWFITVQDDAVGSGGYKIFTSNNANFEMDFKDSSKTTFNNWLEKRNQLQQFFNEAELQVEWTSNQITIEWGEGGKS